MKGFSLAVVCALAGVSAARPGEVVRVEHHDPHAAPSRGPAVAPVTIELFIAPSNQTRLSTFRVLEQLQAEHPTRIRLVYRILWRNENKPAALATLEANAQGKFDLFVKALSELKANPDNKTLVNLAGELAMDKQRMSHALGEHTTTGMLDVADSYSDVLLQVLDDNNTRFGRMIPHTPPPAAMINSKVIALGQLNAQQARDAYEAAYAAAQELLDRGVPPDGLAQAFDREALGEATRGEVRVLPDTPDTNPSVDGSSNEHPLATPPIEVRGLPSYGSDKAPYQIVVLCSPISPNCRTAMDSGRSTQHVFQKEIRIVWAPFFDVGGDDAAALGQLGDAALCAEQIGALGDDDFAGREDSPGWHWVEEIRRETSRSRPRNAKIDADQLIDRVVAKLRIDSKAMSQCRAKLAGTTFDRVAAARHSGVKLSPTVVIGGRIYGAGVKDQTQWQTLVEAELGPGALGASVCAEPSHDSTKEPTLDDRDCSLFRLLMFLGGSGKRSSTE